MKKTLLIILVSFISVSLFAQSQKDLDMIQAAYDGDEARVKYFLEQGANVNAVDAQGYTALIYASAYGYHNIMKMLIDKGAKINEFKNDVNPVFAAVNNDNTKSLEILINARADVNKTDSKGYTPLMLAAQENYHRTARYLLNKRAKIDTENYDGHTALSIAIQRNSKETIDVLLNANPKKSGYRHYSNSPLNIADYMGNKEAEKKLKRYGFKKSLSPGLDFVSGSIGGRYSPYESMTGYELGVHESLTKIDLYGGYFYVPQKSTFEPFTSTITFNMRNMAYLSLNKRFTLYKPQKAGYGFSVGADGYFASGENLQKNPAQTKSEFLYGANANLFRYGSAFLFRIDYHYFVPPTTVFYKHSVSFTLGLKLYKPKTSNSKITHADKTLYML